MVEQSLGGSEKSVHSDGEAERKGPQVSGGGGERL